MLPYEFVARLRGPPVVDTTHPEWTQSLRLFTAFEVPERQKLSIEKALQSLRLALPNARWSKRSNWHLTLKFLGGVGAAQRDEVISVCRSCAESSRAGGLALGDVGAFPSLRRAQVLWISVNDPASLAIDLASRLEYELTSIGIPRETRSYRPHLTVARLPTPRNIADVVADHGPYEVATDPFHVSELLLVRSHLERTGSTYEVIERFPLIIDR